MRDNTHKGGGDTRTQILHFKENPFFSSVFVFATKKNQNKIVSTCWCDECTTNRQDEDAHAAVSLIVHSVDKTSEGMFDFFFYDSR